MRPLRPFCRTRRQGPGEGSTRIPRPCLVDHTLGPRTRGSPVKLPRELPWGRPGHRCVPQASGGPREAVFIVWRTELGWAGWVVHPEGGTCCGEEEKQVGGARGCWGHRGAWGPSVTPTGPGEAREQSRELIRLLRAKYRRCPAPPPLAGDCGVPPAGREPGAEAACAGPLWGGVLPAPRAHLGVSLVAAPHLEAHSSALSAPSDGQIPPITH